MDLSDWCAKHNLPRPVTDVVPTETLIYLSVFFSRRLRDLPTEVLLNLAMLTRRTVAEA